MHETIPEKPGHRNRWRRNSRCDRDAGAVHAGEKDSANPCTRALVCTRGHPPDRSFRPRWQLAWSASKIHELYLQLGANIFHKSWRTFFFPLTRYRYPPEPLESALHEQLGDMKMKDLWKDLSLRDVVITAFDVLTNETCFIKPWKLQYQDWTLVKAVLASSCVPTYFPPVDGRYVDGGVGSYANPCYVAAYELTFCLGWKPEETTLLSFGTGRGPAVLKPGEPERLAAWDWLDPVLDGFLTSASDQQVRLVETFFKKLDFRRFQVDHGRGA